MTIRGIPGNPSLQFVNTCIFKFYFVTLLSKLVFSKDYGSNKEKVNDPYYVCNHLNWCAEDCITRSFLWNRFWSKLQF